MPHSIRIPYSGIGNQSNEVSLMPRLPLSLRLDNQTVDIIGLIDSGASVNVLPYSIGIRLGADWNSQPPLSSLGGNLSVVEVRALAVTAYHPQITPSDGVELLFAWAKSDTSPIILGQINFFLQFDICFFRNEKVFEIQIR